MGSAYGPPFTDWPIAYEDLEPYYDRVEWELGVAGPAGARPHDGPRRRGYPLPPIEDDAAQPVLARGAAALGIATAAVPLLINSVPYGGRPACRRCGTCVGFACQAGAKTGTHNSVIPRALATGRCDLLAGTAATRLLTRGGAVVGAQLGPHAVRARHVVLAAGAIESARLLLVSGVGNEHVGRYLQGHRYAGAAGLFAERVQDSRGPGSSISTTDFRHDNPGVRGGGVLANEFVPIPVEAYAKLTACGLVPPWGQAGLEAMRHAYPRAQFVVGPVQEVPSAESRVTLATVKDAAGVPVARLTGRPDPADAATAQFLSARAAEWLEASGARRIAPVHFRARRGPSAGQHQAGTCRMGAVTDAWGRVHGHAGVTIADASLHVTNGGVNPVLTVLALAWRNAERLAEELS
jgi:choline dehydrogenase-like flavoprotein